MSSCYLCDCIGSYVFNSFHLSVTRKMHNIFNGFCRILLSTVPSALPECNHNVCLSKFAWYHTVIKTVNTTFL